MDIISSGLAAVDTAQTQAGIQALSEGAGRAVQGAQDMKAGAEKLGAAAGALGGFGE